MAYKITEDCISCGACESECKNSAITEGDASYVIDVDKCTECVGWFESPRCAEVCPVGAPQPDGDNTESKDQLLEKFKKLNPDTAPADGTY
ncbi:MAG: YfhL family 4Fe-4S dicluster ferredoxin [Dehalococcoidia bacterium]|nr:MAG: YfhL family 4Fe-4S dicluster ferredoxin [Dehalococcoidia bacterium]